MTDLAPIQPADLLAMDDADLRRLVAQATGILADRQGEFRTIAQLRRIIRALARTGEVH